MQNQLFELARKRRSVRRYAAGHIADDVITEIMKVALTAPCSFGHHPVEFVVVRDKDMIKKTQHVRNWVGTQINGADAVIVVFVKTENEKLSEFWIEDGAVASAYLLLAIEQYDLGACWVHIRNRQGINGTSDEEMRALLNIPDGYTVLNLVAFGERGESKPPYEERNLQYKNIHTEKF